MDTLVYGAVTNNNVLRISWQIMHIQVYTETYVARETDNAITKNHFKMCILTT